MLYNSRNKKNNNNRDYMIAASIKGGPLAPDINGVVKFEKVPGGTNVTAVIYNLPEYQPAEDGQPPIGPFGFHLHEKASCEVGDPSSPFEEAGGHWDPTNQPHGNHVGDFPVIFSNNGYCRMSFFTNRFYPQDALGKTVVIHQNPDDYRSQPAGNAGNRLACGVVDYYQAMHL